MGNTDSIPIVSQAKSGVQLICGDVEGAARTQDNFFHECPVVSQVTSVGQLLTGDAEGALETQKRCGQGLLNAADGIPVVGHAKGVVHYAFGDSEGGNRAMKAATRTTGVMGGGAVGFLVGGPVGAIAGGIEGGLIMDAGTTAVTGEASGYVAALENIRNNPNPGDCFDLVMMPVADGLAGYGAGKMVERLQQPAPSQPKPGGQPPPGKFPSDSVKADVMRAQADRILKRAQASADAGRIKSAAYNARSIKAMRHAQASGTVSQPVGPPKPVPGVKVAPPTNVNIKADKKSETKPPQTRAFDLPLETIVTDTLELLLDDTQLEMLPPLERLLHELLSEDFNNFSLDLRKLKGLPNARFLCFYPAEREFFSILLYKSRYSSSDFVPVTIHLQRDEYEELRDKARTCTEKEARQLLKRMLGLPEDENGEEEKTSSKRGEHVINNGVLKIMPGSIDSYLYVQNKGPFPTLEPCSDYISESSRLYQDYHHPFGSPYKENIETNMKVYVEGWHVDTNSFFFGMAKKALVDKVVRLMSQAPDRQNQIKKEIRLLTTLMYEAQVYVDQEAKVKWLRNGPAAITMYTQALERVKQVLEQLGMDGANLPLRWAQELRYDYGVGR